MEHNTHRKNRPSECLLENSLRGFTFIEIMVVIAIIAIVATMTAVGLSNMGRASALKSAQNEVYQAFSDSRNKTLASLDETVFGVLVGTSSVTKFKGPTFVSGASENRTYDFESGITATGSLVMNGTPVIFARLSGSPSATGTILLVSDDGNATRTVTVHASGLIE